MSPDQHELDRTASPPVCRAIAQRHPSFRQEPRLPVPTCIFVHDPGRYNHNQHQIDLAGTGRFSYHPAAMPHPRWTLVPAIVLFLCAVRVNQADEPQLTPRPGILVMHGGRVLRGDIIRVGDRYVVTIGERDELGVPATSVDLCCDSLEDAYSSKTRHPVNRPYGGRAPGAGRLVPALRTDGGGRGTTDHRSASRAGQSCQRPVREASAGSGTSTRLTRCGVAAGRQHRFPRINWTN